MLVSAAYCAHTLRIRKHVVIKVVRRLAQDDIFYCGCTYDDNIDEDDYEDYDDEMQVEVLVMVVLTTAELLSTWLLLIILKIIRTQ